MRLYFLANFSMTIYIYIQRKIVTIMKVDPKIESTMQDLLKIIISFINESYSSMCFIIITIIIIKYEIIIFFFQIKIIYKKFYIQFFR